MTIRILQFKYIENNLEKVSEILSGRPASYADMLYTNPTQSCRFIRTELSDEERLYFRLAFESQEFDPEMVNTDYFEPLVYEVECSVKGL